MNQPKKNKKVDHLQDIADIQNGISLPKPPVVIEKTGQLNIAKGDFFHEQIVVKNDFNGNIYQATHQPTDAFDVMRAASDFFSDNKNSKKRLLILSGTHGDSEGQSALKNLQKENLVGLTQAEINTIRDKNRQLESQFQKEDIDTAKILEEVYMNAQVQVIDIQQFAASQIHSQLGNKKGKRKGKDIAMESIKKLLGDESQDAYVFAWCYSAQNRRVVHSLKEQINQLIKKSKDPEIKANLDTQLNKLDQ